MATSTPNLDKSLDDIISSKPKNNRRGGGRGGHSSARRNIIGNPRTDGGLNRTPRSTPPTTGRPAVPGGNKIIISNLPLDVSEREVTELFSTTVGAVKECTINYDHAGHSKGSASVIFNRSGDALQAYNQYNNRLIDGKRTLRIEIVVDPSRGPPAPSLASRVGGEREPRDARMTDASAPRRGEGRGPRRGRGGRGGRNRDERPKKTVEDLDAEMEDYNATNDEPAPEA
ncbi:hypothetical protein FS837_012946 [Tulasnella sp. UAMH 9824]|nr:hypothetical protein FS837_012946 [Tulasnella sp. UAMH 9824]